MRSGLRRGVSQKAALILGALAIAIGTGVLGVVLSSRQDPIFEGYEPQLTEISYEASSVVYKYTLKAPFPEFLERVRSQYPGWHITILGSEVVFHADGLRGKDSVLVLPARVAVSPPKLDWTYGADWCLVELRTPRTWPTAITMWLRGKRADANFQDFKLPVKNQVTVMDSTYFIGHVVRGTTALDMRAMPEWLKEVYRRQFGSLDLRLFERKRRR